MIAIKIINPNDYNEGILEINTYNKLKQLNTQYLLTMIDCFKVIPIHRKYYSEEYKTNHDSLNDHIVIILPLMACSTYDLLKCKEYENGLPYEICKKIIYQTLLGIKELEINNLMHTDLKPENILVNGLNREAELLLKTIEGIDIISVHDDKFQNIKKSSSDDDWVISYNIYKNITKSIIKFINNNMQNVKEEMKKCKISSKYLENIEIKICDFNLVLNYINKLGNKNIEIQTRYYRSPEIILGNGLHKNTDYWSIGCILFELLTGNLLFDPKRTKTMLRDTHHIYLIESIINIIPIDFLNNSRRYNKIFDNYPQKKKNFPLKKILYKYYNNLGLSTYEINNILSFFKISLSINPDDRQNIDILLNMI